MWLTRFRGWVGATTVGSVGALLLALVLLTGIDPLPDAGFEPAEQAGSTSAPARTDEASSSREEGTPGGADPSGQPPAPPTLPPVSAQEAITYQPPDLVPSGQRSDAPEPSESGSGGGGDGAGDAGPEGAVLSLVNQERAAAGCAALSADGALTGLARAHSADMRDRNFFSHTNPSGQSPFDRADAAGIGNLGAENIAAGQSSAAAVMASWMGSEGHRANILNCSLRTLGVGVAYGGSYGIYWTQAFGR